MPLLDLLPALKSWRIILASASPRRRELLTQLGLVFTVMPSTFAEDLDKSTFSTPAAYVRETARRKAMEVHERVLRDSAGASSAAGSSGATAGAGAGGRDAAGAGARAVTTEGGPVLIISADTIVVRDDTILEKPKDADDARAMIASLSGSEHQVYTAIALMAWDTSLHDARPAGPADSDIAAPTTSDGSAATTDGTPGTCVKVFHEETKVTFCNLDPETIDAYVATGEPLDKAGGYGIQGVAGSFVSGIHGCYYNVVGLPLNRLCAELRPWVQETPWARG